uniref:TF-B3 domain-containing protein n=1 Tax=Oryza glaberrima TaxID=4538 RepID=I1R7J5_ORYGL
MGDQKRSFINVMIGDFVAVPTKFANFIRGQISEVVKLEVPNGKTYDVQVAKEHNELVLRSGWGAFARDYELKQCDILVFTYSGSSRFKVRIFNPSGCEKELSCVMMNNTPCGHEGSMSYHDNHLQSPSESSLLFNISLPPHSPFQELSGVDSTSLLVSDPTNMQQFCLRCSWTNPKRLAKPSLAIASLSHQHLAFDKTRCMFILKIENDTLKTILKMFAKNVQGLISGVAKLEVPDGKTYDVEISKEHNELVFRSGWEVFAIAYELEQGDILAFGYSGNSHFKVQIFNPSNCEKELSCVVMNRSISDDNHRQSPRRERMNKPSTTCMDCITNHYWLHMDDRERYFFKVMMSVSDIKDELAIPKKFAANVRGKIPEQVRLEVSDDVPSSEDIKDPMSSGGLQKSKKSCYVLPMLYNMTSAQEAEVLALEKKIQPQIPLYITAMDKTSVASGSLVFSKDYAVRYLLDQNRTIKLCQSGGSKTWDISLDMDTDDLYALSTGWLDFFRGNLLQEGDICVFEASMSKRGVALTFHPFKESHCPKSSEYTLSTKSPTRRVPKRDYFATNLTNLTDQQERKCFSVKYASKYLPHKDQNMRLRLPETKYKCKAALHIDTSTNLHKLLKGWGKFVNDNKLEIHDICLFQLMKNKKKLTMTVHIIRKGECS